VSQSKQSGDIDLSSDLSPEAVLARATAARGDIFPEWKTLVYASPKTYHLINQTVSYLHQYHGQQAASGQLSIQMRELIAIAALCTRGEVELAAQHMRRAYDYGMTRRQVLDAICCVVPMTGMVSATLGLRAMRLSVAQ
jgi:alkylhydroperoxidase/carboxymuconolactone decarboxylase family protein YurZ